MRQQIITKCNIRMLAAGLVLNALAFGAVAAEPYVNATVGGVLAPGVYGQIQIGNAPPPPVLYPQPVIITRPQVVVQQEPLYLYVPPGHVKKWSKHCAAYDACGRPVYFVNMARYQRDHEHGDGRDRGHGKGKGHGHQD